MQKELKVSTILTWFNMIVWALFTGIGLLETLFTGNFFFLIITFMMSVFVLHSYAALQLHKSIKNPAVPLSSQTPVGIRFIGFAALFFGIGFFTQGLAILQNIRELVKLMEPQLTQLPPEVKGMDLNKLFRGIGIFSLVTGICIAVNVFLNFRLLRWYLFFRENEIK
jgi:hypothetical protein